jgi:hypothetical protein
VKDCGMQHTITLKHLKMAMKHVVKDSGNQHTITPTHLKMAITIDFINPKPKF